jgi:hypothetical protein
MNCKFGARRGPDFPGRATRGFRVDIGRVSRHFSVTRATYPATQNGGSR